MSDIPLTAFGEVFNAEFTPTCGWSFAYNVNADMVTSGSSGGTVTSGSGMAVLATGAAASQSAYIQTNRVVRYTPGVGGLARFTTIFTAGKAGSTQLIGVGNTEDGFFVGFNGATFGFCRRKGGVDTWTPVASWSGQGKEDILNYFDPTKGNIWQITWQWLGFGAVRLYMEDPDTGTLKLVHMWSPVNTLTGTTILNPVLPLYAYTANTTNNTNVVLKTPSGIGGVQGARFGPPPIHPFSFYRTVKAGKAAVTTETNILTLKNGTTFQTVANRVRVRLTALNILGEGTGTSTVTIQIKKNATLGGSPSYTAYNADTSPCTYDVAGTTVTGGVLVFSGEIARNAGDAFDLERYGIELAPGETATVSVTSAAAVAPDLALTWVDLF